MSISVLFPSYTKEQYQQVIDHYNSIKPSHHMAIEELESRCEGGFQIRLNQTELKSVTSGDANAKIRQLRWTRRKLDRQRNEGFTKEETLRLYHSLVHVFGEAFVSYL
jgi:hypothetical protein